MLVETVGALFAAGSGYLWLRHMRDVRLTRRPAPPRQRAPDAAEFEHAFVSARAQLPSRRYRAADERDRARLAGLARRLREPAAQLLAEGFVDLGDVVACFGDKPRLYGRAFVDRDGTTCALAAVHGPAAASSVALVSYRRDDWYATRVQTGIQLAEPPCACVQHHPAATPVADLIARHRAFARAYDPARGFVRVIDRDGFVAELVRSNAAILAWREAQPPDALLDADLRAVLGNHSDAWAHRFRAEPPRAIARERSSTSRS